MSWIGAEDAISMSHDVMGKGPNSIKKNNDAMKKNQDAMMNIQDAMKKNQNAMRMVDWYTRDLVRETEFPVTSLQ